MGKNENNNIQKIQDFSKRETLTFAKEHQGEDTARLLLSATRYPSIDMPAAVQQIEGLCTAQEKWPSLLACEEFLYPPRLNREQASSEAAALHKAALYFQSLEATCSKPLHIADLTGGMGIDTFALAGWGAEEQMEVEVDYVEQNPELCKLTQSNAQALGLNNIHVHCGDSMEWLRQQNRLFDLIFIDPARRDKQGRKVSAFEDGTPDLLGHLQMLREHCRHLLVKASPMIDIQLAVGQLGEVGEVHVVALRGECKEVLFLLPGAESAAVAASPQIHCVDIDGCTFKPRWARTFTWEEEAASIPAFASEVEAYLYEPTASLMKGGCYNSICRWFEVRKLARNTHLYTSDRLIEDFPGRIFAVRQPVTLNAKEVRKLLPEGRAHVVTRNFPLEAAALQRQLKLREGGHLFILAATIGSRPAGWLCEML